MRIGVPRQSQSRERRVGLTPTGAAKLVADGHEVFVEVGAGLKSGLEDNDYRDAGATVEQRGTVIGDHGLVVQTVGPAIDELSQPDWSRLNTKHTLVALHDPLWDPGRAEALASTGATIVSLDLIPRITRAQSMDVLSSMSTVAGYQAVLLAAGRIPRLFPMLMTAGGTVPPTKILVLGAGVAGLQAIATARRLGAVVEGYDIRSAAMEQIASLGARPIDLQLETEQSEDAEGYARAQSDDLTRRQNEALLPHIADADIVISTAAIPGAASPELITTEMVDAMRPGSVIIDLAAERGGNCRLSEPDGEVKHNGVLILGPTDLPSRAAATASLMFSNNVVALIRHLTGEDNEVHIDLDDEITSGTVVGFNGEVVHAQVRAKLGLSPMALPSEGPSGNGAGNAGDDDQGDHEADGDHEDYKDGDEEE
jgi:NAD(P) transhydrogenase subunit alpha